MMWKLDVCIFAYTISHYDTTREKAANGKAVWKNRHCENEKEKET